jgi:hypothetical protein
MVVEVRESLGQKAAAPANVVTWNGNAVKATPAEELSIY